MISHPAVSTANRTVLTWSGVLAAAVLVWFISVFGLVLGGKLGSMGYLCAAVGMVLVIAFVAGLSYLVNRRLLRPGSRNTAHPVLVASLVVAGWYLTLTAIVGILAALNGLTSENGVATSTWYTWLIGGAVAIVGCVSAAVYAARR